MLAVISMIVVALLLAASIVVLAVRGGLSIGVGDPGKMEPIHLPSLTNLLDEAQQDYLRTELPKKDFVALQRLRNKALLVYVKRIAKNAATLMRVAHLATQASDPETAEAGRELLQLALSTRIFALRAMGRLYLGVLMPRTVKPLSEALARYSRATDQFALLGRRTGQQIAG